MNTEIASRNFVVDASQERVWRLVGKVILNSLPAMEEVEILDERNFHAFLRVKISWIELTMKLKGEIVDMVPPDLLAVNLALEGLRGFFRMNQKVTINMFSTDQGRTTVACKAVAEGIGIFSRRLFLGQARHFAQSTFASIEKRLQELA